MTFTDILNEVLDRMDESSTTAQNRIGRAINERHRWIASHCGLDMIQTQKGIQVSSVIGNRTMTWSPATTTPSVGVEKILAIYNPATTPPFVLDEVLLDDLNNQLINSDPPQQWALLNIGSNFVTVQLDVIPASIYPLQADVLVNLTTLSGLMTPVFPEDFHNAIVYGVMATEYEHKDMFDKADAMEAKFNARVERLVQWVAESAYLDIFQGKTSGDSDNLTTPLV